MAALCSSAQLTGEATTVPRWTSKNRSVILNDMRRLVRKLIKAAHYLWPTPMRRTERLNAILDLVAGAGSVDVVHLASCLGVSGATIRRDLQSLSRRNLLVRTHGGAVANAVATAVATGLAEAVPDRATPDRTNRLSEKRRIAQAAAALVSEGAVVGMTGGTTATELARALADRHGITVVTNALNIAADLTTRPGTRLVVITGMARHGSYELVGPAAEAMWPTTISTSPSSAWTG
jgi:DeoR family transcriptional regulator of aga operon